MTAESVENYAQARWSDLVRTLVTLGADVADAELTAQDALATCWSAWRTEHRDGDVDVLVYGQLLDLWAARRQPAPTDDEVARVLARGVGLQPHQVEMLSGAPSPTASPWSAEEWDDRYVGSAPVDAIRDAVRRARRRRVVGTAAVTAFVLVVAVAILLVRGGAADEDLSPDPPEARNSIPLAWWSDDVLHLGRVEVEVPGLLSLAQAGTDPTYSVVYGDSSGQVVQVDADGSSRRIGTSAPGAAILGSASGLVTWVDRTAGDPDTVVWDTMRGTPAASSTAADRPFTVEGRRMVGSPTGRLVATWDPDTSTVTVTPSGTPAGTPFSLVAPGSGVLGARFVDDDTLVVISIRTQLVGRDYDDGLTLSGRFPVADLGLCDLVDRTCVVAERRAQDVDPSATTSTIVLAR